MDQLTLTPPIDPVQDTLSLFPPGQEQPPVVGTTAVERSHRHDLALAAHSPGREAVENSITSGMEVNLRDTAALLKAGDIKQERKRAIDEAIQSGQIRTPEQAQQAAIDYNTPVNVDPNIVLETSFAEEYLKMVEKLHRPKPLSEIQAQAEADSETLNQIPYEAFQAMTGPFKRIIERNMIAHKELEEVQARAGKLSTIEYGVNFIGNMAPVINSLAKNETLWGAILPGSSMEKERDKFWSFADPSEAQKWLAARIKTIEAWNPVTAVDYAQGIVSTSYEDVWVGNVFSIGGATLTAGQMAAARLMANAVKATAGGKLRAEDVAAGIGDLDAAADIISAKQALNKRDRFDLTYEIKNLPLLSNPRPIFDLNDSAMAADRRLKMATTIEAQGGSVMQGILDAPRVQRLDQPYHVTMNNQTKERIFYEFPTVHDYVNNAQLHYSSINNAYYTELIITKRDGTYGKPLEMQRIAEKELGLPHESFRIVQQDPLTPISATSKFDFNQTVPVNTKGMAATTASPNRLAGFKSLQGDVRLTDGSEVRVSNRKDGIFKVVDGKASKERVDPNSITAFKTTAKDSQWTEIGRAAPPKIKMPTTQKAFDAMVKSQGNGWYISIVRPVDETDPVIRQLDLPSTNQAPVSAANTWLKGLLRSAEDMLPYFQREGRHIATHAPNAVQRFMVETAQNIGSLSKESHKQLENVLEANKAAISHAPDGTQIRGEAFRSQGALEREWRARNGRLPTDQESLAYWTYHQLMDIDWALRNFAVHRDLARQGIGQLYTVRAPHEVDGVARDAITVPGKFVHELPMQSKSDWAVLLMEDGKPALHIWKSEMAGDLDKRLAEMLKSQGYKAIQVANPMDRPFGAIFDKDTAPSVHFVITKDSTTKPLPMNLVDRNPGVHIIYPQEHWVKQPIVKVGRNGRMVNYGDRNILAADSEVEAKRVSKAVTKLQEMIRNKATDAELDAFIGKNLPRDAAFWREQFSRHIDMDAPIVNTHSGKSTFDTHPDLTKRPEYSNMFSERDSEWNGFRSVNMDFMSDRDAPLMQVQNKGSIDKPLYVLEQARTVSAFASLNRALGNSIRHHFMNDYRTSAIEQWAAQFGHLTTLGRDVAVSNPFHVFYNGEIKPTIGDTLVAQEVHAAENVRARIKNFVGAQTEFGKDLDHFQARIINAITEKTGSERVARWYNDNELRAIKDPISALRAMMYHFKFGLFNPKQFFVQAQGFTHIASVLTGAHGVTDGFDLTHKSMSAYMFNRAMQRTDQASVKEALVNKAVAMGWNRNQYIEATRLLDQSGFGIIGREHSLRDGVMDPTLWTTSGGKVLDAGGGFFKAGERLVRETAFYAAYLEWRKANPTKKLDQFSPGEILRRADDLSLNMTRASHSAVQEGFWRLPTQFYTFSQRIMEQFWGGRLSNQEKLAAFTGHSMMYGIPAAAGAVTLMPVYDMIRQQALLDGDGNVHNQFFKLATEGFISYAFWHLTGKEYNFGQRYGPGFSDQLVKLFGGELSALELAGGASGSFIESMAKATYPFYSHVKAGLMGSQHAFPLLWSDIQPMLKEVSSYSDASNALAAIFTQKYVSKSGNLLANDMSAMDAGAIMLGLTRRDIQDARLIEFGIKDQEAHQRRMKQMATNELKVAYQYMADGDMSKAEAHFARAKVFMVVFGDLRDAEIVRTITEVHKANEPLTQRARERFLKEGYAGQLGRRLQMLLEQR